MNEREFLTLAIGRPVLDDRGDACIVVAKAGDRITVAYGDYDDRMLSARFDAFRVAGPGMLRWDGRNWALAQQAGGEWGRA